MKAQIHRGAHEIGGNCIELQAACGARLVLDLGWPITAASGEDVPLPDIPGLADGDDPSLAGVLISHPHPDHFGLLRQISARVPVYIGAAASRILSEAAFFSPAGLALKPAGNLAHRTEFALGPFTITPYLNDHSAFDAYSLLVEADGRGLFYTGDIRGHGRKAGIFEELLRLPPTRVDVLLMEGTQVRADSRGDDAGPSEQDVEDACVETIEKTHGIVLAMFSPQNIDRLVTIYRATVRSDRDLVIDLYAASVLKATRRSTIPQADWERVRVYLPRSQRSRVIREQAFERTDAVKPHRIYAEELMGRRDELVMLFRPSMARELERVGCLEGAQVVWSMWPGYLQHPSGQHLQKFLERNHIPMVVHHASGHAHIADLRRLVDALEPGIIVPIHSFATGRFQEFFPRVQSQADGSWWEI